MATTSLEELHDAISRVSQVAEKSLAAAEAVASAAEEKAAKDETSGDAHAKALAEKPPVWARALLRQTRVLVDRIDQCELKVQQVLLTRQGSKQPEYIRTILDNHSTLEKTVKELESRVDHWLASHQQVADGAATSDAGMPDAAPGVSLDAGGSTTPAQSGSKSMFKSKKPVTPTDNTFSFGDTPAAGAFSFGDADLSNASTSFTFGDEAAATSAENNFSFTGQGVPDAKQTFGDFSFSDSGTAPTDAAPTAVPVDPAAPFAFNGGGSSFQFSPGAAPAPPADETTAPVSVFANLSLSGAAPSGTAPLAGALGLGDVGPDGELLSADGKPIDDEAETDKDKQDNSLSFDAGASQAPFSFS